MAKVTKVKQVNLNQMFIDLFTTGQSQEVEINRIRIEISLIKRPKGISIHVAKQHGDCHGFGCAAMSMEHAISVIRHNYLNIAKQQLSEVELPPERMWYVYVCRGKHYPIGKHRYEPKLEDYLIKNPQTIGSEDEYFFDIPSHIAPELCEFPRKGDTVFIPKNSVWHITDHFELEKIDYDSYRQ